MQYISLADKLKNNSVEAIDGAGILQFCSNNMGAVYLHMKHRFF